MERELEKGRRGSGRDPCVSKEGRRKDTYRSRAGRVVSRTWQILPSLEPPAFLSQMEDFGDTRMPEATISNFGASASPGGCAEDSAW